MCYCPTLLPFFLLLLLKCVSCKLRIILINIRTFTWKLCTSLLLFVLLVCDCVCFRFFLLCASQIWSTAPMRWTWAFPSWQTRSLSAQPTRAGWWSSKPLSPPTTSWCMETRYEIHTHTRPHEQNPSRAVCSGYTLNLLFMSTSSFWSTRRRGVGGMQTACRTAGDVGHTPLMIESDPECREIIWLGTSWRRDGKQRWIIK